MNLLQMQFKKHDDLHAATKQLKDDSLEKQMNLYFAICLQMCERFSNEEVLKIISEQATGINERGSK